MVRNLVGTTLKIKPDKKVSGKKQTFRFCEELDEGFYWYAIYGKIKKKRIRICISNLEVSIDFYNGGSIFTNLTPASMFPGHDHLDWGQITEILEFLETTKMEGKRYSRKQFKKLKKKGKL